MNIYKEITLIIVSYKSENLIQKNIDIIKKFQTIIVENSSSNKIDKLVNTYNTVKSTNSTYTKYVLVKKLNECYLLSLHLISLTSGILKLISIIELIVF